MHHCTLISLLSFTFIIMQSHAVELLMLDKQLSMLAASSTASKLPPYTEECRHKPRLKRNLSSICYLSTAIDIAHRLYCNEQFRRAVVPVPAPIYKPVLTEADKDAILRYETIKILKAYDNPGIGDIAFVSLYDEYIATIASLDMKGFAICKGGGSPYGTIIDIVNRLTQTTLLGKPFVRIEALQDVPIQQFILVGPEQTPQPSTFVEQSIFGCCVPSSYAILNSPQFTTPKFLLLAINLGSINVSIEALERNEKPPIQLSFPRDVFNLMQYTQLFDYPEKQSLLKPVYYRLCAIAAQQKGHVVSLIRYGSDWHLCSDGYVMKLNDKQMQSFAQEGYIRMSKKNPITKLIQKSSQHQEFSIMQQSLGYSDYLVVSMLLYERVD